MTKTYSYVNEVLIEYYQSVQRYAQITISLLQQNLLDYEQALCKIRTKLYESYNQIYEFVVPLDRKIERFNKQVLATLNYPSLRLSQQFWQSHQKASVDQSLFHQALTDFDIFDDFLENMLVSAYKTAHVK